MTQIYDKILYYRKIGKFFCLVTVVDSTGQTPRKAGAKALVFPDKSIEGTIGGGAIEVEAIKQAASVIASRKTLLRIYDLDKLEEATMTCGGSMTLFYEPIFPQRVLTIFGGGHVGRALARIAAEAGWQIRVIDDRGGILKPVYFPENTELITEQYNNYLSSCQFSENDWLVIVTPRHENDEQVLQRIIHFPAAYIGMMGSPKKVKEVNENLLSSGISEVLLQKVHAPIGLNIGTETPGEIAVAIVAEMLAIYHNISSVKKCSL